MDSSLDFVELPPSQLEPNDWNAQDMDEATFTRLVDEIANVGFIEPIQVVQVGEDRYRIIGGEHRWKASLELKLETVPCIILPGDKWRDEDLQKFVSVRLNVLRGRLDPEKFIRLYEEMADKYGSDAIQDLMAITDDKAFEKLVGTVKKGMKDALPKEMHKEFEGAADDAKNVEDLSKIIGEMFNKYGDTVQQSYMIFTYGKKKHVYVSMNDKLHSKMDSVLKICSKKSVDINDLLAPALDFVIENTD